MMRVLLLLSACVCLGSSYQEYGDTFKIYVSRRTSSVEFIPPDSAQGTILWRRGDPPAGDKSRHKVEDRYLVIKAITQRDNGRYILKDDDDNVILSRSLNVNAVSRSYQRNPRESFSFDFDLKQDACNIYYLPENEGEIELIHRGRLNQGLDDSYCGQFEKLYMSCGILIEDTRASCSGRFEVRDQNGDTALLVELEMLQPPPSEFNTSHLGIGIGVALSILSCCCSICRCCFGKSSSKKEEAETPDSEPAVHYHQYETEPAAARSDPLSQTSETHYPTLPSYTPMSPLIHDPPTVDTPPTYSQVSAPAEEAAAPAVLDNSDPGPRFELSFPSALPLSSDTPHSGVYTSDKLNFL